MELIRNNNYPTPAMKERKCKHIRKLFNQEAVSQGSKEYHHPVMFSEVGVGGDKKVGREMLLK